MEGIIDNLLITKRKSPLIKVVGVGGGGGNTVNFMYENSDAEVSYVVMNTDSQALESSPIPNKLLLGPNITEGLGAGANPSTAEEAAMASKDDIKKILDDGAKMVFITAGMGGGQNYPGRRLRAGGAPSRSSPLPAACRFLAAPHARPQHRRRRAIRCCW